MGFNGDLMGFIRIYDGTFYPMTDPNGAAFFWCSMDPILNMYCECIANIYIYNYIY